MGLSATCTALERAPVPGGMPDLVPGLAVPSLAPVNKLKLQFK